jgi:hypothetical protein
VSEIQEVTLSLREVEEYIRAFEHKYGISSADFLCKDEVREQIAEDDVFKWEAFIDHRQELQVLDEEVLGRYLKDLKSPPHGVVKRSDFDQVFLAP